MVKNSFSTVNQVYVSGVHNCFWCTPKIKGAFWKVFYTI